MSSTQPLGPAQSRAAKTQQPWHWRARQWAMAYMPILLMALLASSTWWLIKNSPTAKPPTTAQPPRHEPDYEMRHFSVQRHSQNTNADTKIEGEHVRHYPDTDTLEIDRVRLRTVNAQGQVTTAVAHSALAKGDASEVELLGNAEVTRENGPNLANSVHVQSNHLHAFIDAEKLVSHKPVTISQAGTQVKAEAMTYTHQDGIIVFTGRPRATFAPKK